MSRALRAAPLFGVLAVAAVVVLGARSPVHLEPELSWAAPSWERPLGSGEGGVDLLALVAHASLRAVVLAVAVALAGFLVGCPLGASAAVARGRLERAVTRACDLVQAFPTFLLALVVLSAVRAPSRVHLGAVFVLTAWAPFTRLALAQTRVLREQAFVEAARALGVTPARVIARHLVPNLLGVVAVQLGGTAAAVVVSEAALSFVGFGARDGVSLGVVLDQGVSAMLRAPHVLLVGAAAVFVTSVSLMAAGRVFDPAFAVARRQH
ncbi:MAG: ABC transporter permease [Labilithrix sp.]|nr:ABC transporter permease [Labilithrix sp.]MCW5814871.1 ABC transporter permease [Labilithrix sp.]